MLIEPQIGEHDTGETEVDTVCPQAGEEGGRRSWTPEVSTQNREVSTQN
jgi:hypothetical protein